MENKNNLKMIPCGVSSCKDLMPELRLIKFGYKVCVKCSTVKAKRGVPVMFGTKDNTWTDLVVMEDKDFQQYKEREKNSKKGLDKFSD
tara:strand:- start:3464 stop:3727 length:264 start_codon:yes stop_codon:yes gene_type:complete